MRHRVRRLRSRSFRDRIAERPARGEEGEEPGSESSGRVAGRPIAADACHVPQVMDQRSVPDVGHGLA